ncbi:MAG: hypothetical protein JO159_10350 [Acidobacteria bacterium]|nr:hypothetical protein [Acidobacteriota bacterium]
METLAITSPPSYDLLIVTIASVLAVGFMIWFLTALVLNARKSQASTDVYHKQHNQLTDPLYHLTGRDFNMECEHAGHSLDSCDSGVLRDLDQLRAFLRSPEVRKRRTSLRKTT